MVLFFISGSVLVVVAFLVWVTVCGGFCFYILFDVVIVPAVQEIHLLMCFLVCSSCSSWSPSSSDYYFLCYCHLFCSCILLLLLFLSRTASYSYYFQFRLIYLLFWEMASEKKCSPASCGFVVAGRANRTTDKKKHNSCR